jgi:hypothetical protein
MSEPVETSWVKWKRRVRRAIRRHPGTVFVFTVIYFYLADCVIAHKSHPEVSWLASGVLCRGPFGFVATLALSVAGVVYFVKKGY